MEQVEQTPETPAEEPVPAPEQKKGLSENAKEWIKDILIAIVVAFLVLQFIKPTIVQEHSMENTLVANDYLFISKQSYRLFGDPQRGDIIVFHSSLTTSDGSEKLLVKRIIAIPGDTISITGGVVYINGEPQDEPYTKDGYTNTEMDEVYVPEGKLFCMGDNRQNSRDSRDSAIGLVDEDDVLGKAVFRLFPFSRIGGLY
ncbi:MAG: signal peptidase I [Firmicutes bacterium]|nr:signal peptidase I [Bacillota bacterium]MBQ2094521.1 signal peptidase I [Bacillota bacterium]MBQ2218747.1 signal peptidase I [Bacillota bacterium]MBQ4004497.1 signal peptidase I [Bacillota bacterium]